MKIFKYIKSALSFLFITLLISCQTFSLNFDPFKNELTLNMNNWANYDFMAEYNLDHNREQLYLILTFNSTFNETFEYILIENKKKLELSNDLKEVKTRYKKREESVYYIDESKKYLDDSSKVVEINHFYEPYFVYYYKLYFKVSRDLLFSLVRDFKDYFYIRAYTDNKTFKDFKISTKDIVKFLQTLDEALKHHL